MRKAIRLKMMLQVEGEAAPTADFAKLTTQAARDVFGAGRWRHPGLRFTIVSVAEDTSEDDGDADMPPARPP